MIIHTKYQFPKMEDVLLAVVDMTLEGRQLVLIGRTMDTGNPKTKHIAMIKAAIIPAQNGNRMPGVLERAVFAWKVVMAPSFRNITLPKAQELIKQNWPKRTAMAEWDWVRRSNKQ